jgi:hypothetical protein
VKRYGLELLYFVKRLMLLLICHRFCALVHVVGLAQLDSEWIHWGTDWLFLLCLHTDPGMLACLLPHSQKVPISNVHPASSSNARQTSFWVNKVPISART